MGMFSSQKLPPVPEGPDYKEIDAEASEERRRRMVAGGGRASNVFAAEGYGTGSASKLLGG
jgi:hypothetical protein